MTNHHEAGEDIFRLPPVSLLRMPPCEEEEAGGEEYVTDHDTESEMGEEDNSDPLISSVDASSAPVANLLYLSDQVRTRDNVGAGSLGMYDCIHGDHL